MRKHILPLLATAAAVLSTPAAAAKLDEARSAYGIYDVNKAETLYRAVADDATASAKDRGAAQTELARIAWLVDADKGKALSLLSRALSDNPDPCPTAFLYGRVLNDGDDHATIPAKLKPYVQTCLEIEPGVAIESVRAQFHDASSRPAAERPRWAASALASWKALPARARRGLSGSKLQLSIGLAANDPGVALAGWRAYFWLADETATLQAFTHTDAEVQAAFEKGVPAAASTEQALALAALLMRAGFYDDLRQYVHDRALDRAAPPERWKPFAIYLAMREKFSREILAHDRAYARRGPTEEDAYEKRLGTIYTETAVALGGTETDPMPVLYRAYGLWGTLPGKSNGVSGIHLGHAVIDERQPVEQDGRTGTIRFIAIDNMVHNSFSAWLMDGISAPGGWAANADTIVQVRPRYLESIDSLAVLTREGPARARLMAQIEEQRISDRTIATKTPIAYLSGTRSRLRLQGLDGLAIHVSAALKPGEDHDQAFAKAYWEAINSTSITAHEGRHVLDQASFKDAAALSNPEMEYRGKLSEIGFARYPRIALASIYSPLFGGESGHGIANKRLMGDYAAWMAAHRGEIAGYDPALTELEQLDKLTDDQLRAVVRALDPSAPKS